MDIRIALEMLLEMLTLCLTRIDNLTKPQNDEENDLEEDIGPLAIQVIMVDIIVQQASLLFKNLLKLFQIYILLNFR